MCLNDAIRVLNHLTQAAAPILILDTILNSPTAFGKSHMKNLEKMRRDLARASDNRLSAEDRENVDQSMMELKSFGEDVIREAVQHAIDHRVFVFAAMRAGANTPIAYHFHFLITKQSNQPVAICLDTNDVVPLEEEIPEAAEMKSVCNRVLESFFAKATMREKSSDTERLKARHYFPKSDQRLWDKFNFIKENSFVGYVYDAMDNKQLSEMTKKSKLIEEDELMAVTVTTA